jgi:hypothetical protein
LLFILLSFLLQNQLVIFYFMNLIFANVWILEGEYVLQQLRQVGYTPTVQYFPIITWTSIGIQSHITHSLSLTKEMNSNSK